jgi:small subunit ribosomal protein S6
MLKRYQDLVTKNGGNVHRVEDIGRLQLAYTIKDMHKAHYVLMNLECDSKTLSEIESSFAFNDSIMRHLVVRMTKAETSPSKLFLLHNKVAERKQIDPEIRDKGKTADQQDNMKLAETTDQDTNKDLAVKSETDLNESDTLISETQKEGDSETQKEEDPETQKEEDPETQKEEDPETQKEEDNDEKV